MSDSLQPHGLYSPWNSPGQNTGVGSLCLLQGIFPTQGSNPDLPHCRRILYQLSHKGSPRILEWVSSVHFSSVTQLSPTLCDPVDYTVHGNCPGQNTGVGNLSLLQGIFQTQGSNPGLPHCRQILYQLNHKGSPRILEWVAYPFSRGSSQPRESNWGLLHCRRIFSQLSYQGSPLLWDIHY